MGLNLYQRELYHSAVSGGIDYENWKYEDSYAYQRFFEDIVKSQIPEEYAKIKPYVEKGTRGMGYKIGIRMIAKLKEEYNGGSSKSIANAKKKTTPKKRNGFLWAGK